MEILSVKNIWFGRMSAKQILTPAISIAYDFLKEKQGKRRPVRAKLAAPIDFSWKKMDLVTIDEPNEENIDVKIASLGIWEKAPDESIMSLQALLDMQQVGKFRKIRIIETVIIFLINAVTGNIPMITAQMIMLLLQVITRFHEEIFEVMLLTSKTDMIIKLTAAIKVMAIQMFAGKDLVAQRSIIVTMAIVRIVVLIIRTITLII